MKKKLIVAVLGVLVSTWSFAMEVTTCQGLANGFVANHAGPYPIQVTITEFTQGHYELNYVGPVYTLGDSENGFTVLLNSSVPSDSASLVATPDSKIFFLENQAEGEFSFELMERSRLNLDQITGRLKYRDGKPIAIEGNLICTKRSLSSME